MSRAFNFSAGPAALPEPVLQQAREEMLEWRGERASVMEVSHRGKAFVALAEESEADLRELLAVPTTTPCCSCRAAPPSTSRRYR
jgi:phosphoserine aminotransferase